MDKNTIPTSLAPEVIIEKVLGNLQVKGWERSEIQVRTGSDDVSIQEKDDVVHVSCKGDCTIRIPSAASVQVNVTQGNARFKLLDDTLTIGKVNGNLMLRNVGDVSITEINGELMVRQVTGNFQVDSVNGNAILRSVLGNCELNRVNGNLELKDVSGNIQAKVNGNARLRLYDLSGDSYEVEAKGNLNCEIPGNSDLSLKLTSNDQNIRVQLPGNSQTYRQESVDLTLGQGGKSMMLNAKGSLSISGIDEASREGSDEDSTNSDGFTGFPDDFSERIAQQVETQIEAQMEAMTRQMNEQLAQMSISIGKSGMSEQEADRIIDEARVKGEEAAAQAQEKMRRAQEKLERKLEAHQKRTEAQSRAAERRAQSSSRRGWQFNWSPPPKPPTPPKGPVTEEERLMILKMLEQKKISLDEATQLLEALEGKAA